MSRPVLHQLRFQQRTLLSNQFNSTFRHARSSVTPRQYWETSPYSTTSPQPAKPDFIIVGSGAAGMTAALRAKHHGLSPLIVEKAPVIGGCSGYSGGGLWIPCSGVHKDVDDSIEEALMYMETLIGDAGPASSRERKLAFLTNGPNMIKFLQELGFKWVPCKGYPDYYPDLPGGKKYGRSIEGDVFDAKQAGSWFRKLNMSLQMKGMPIRSSEVNVLVTAAQSWAGLRTGFRIFITRKLKGAMMGRYPVTMGSSLIAQLATLLQQQQVPIWTDTPMESLVVRDGRVTGIIVRKDGNAQELEASKGVLLSAGGFAHNAAMREEYHPSPVSNKWTNTPPSDTGDAITAATSVGAATALMDAAWWGPTTINPDGNPQWCQVERMLPHSMVVDKSGRRFTNEAQSYISFTRDQFARHAATATGVPAYLVFDSRHRKKYVFLGLSPGRTPKKWFDSKTLFKADTLRGLAEQLGVDPSGLEQETSRFNGFVEKGVDDDFHRGESAYDQYFGDKSVTPNPNLGSILKPPFYAVRLWPGDLGTKGGILTDEFARALRNDGSVIEGLYATGNSSASVMGRQYAGAGSTLGPGMTFGFVAVEHVAGKGAEGRKGE